MSHKAAEIILIYENKNFILAAFQMIALDLENLKNSQKVIIINFLLRLKMLLALELRKFISNFNF